MQQELKSCVDGSKNKHMKADFILLVKYHYGCVIVPPKELVHVIAEEANQVRFRFLSLIRVSQTEGCTANQQYQFEASNPHKCG
jgi:hypothetical protein